MNWDDMVKKFNGTDSIQDIRRFKLYLEKDIIEALDTFSAITSMDIESIEFKHNKEDYNSGENEHQYDIKLKIYITD